MGGTGLVVLYMHTFSSYYFYSVFIHFSLFSKLSKLLMPPKLAGN
jgi:hypothetical protein